MKFEFISLVMALLGIFLCLSPAWTQPVVEWEAPFGTADEQVAIKNVRDSQGNSYVLAQEYNENTYADILVLKYDPQGTLLWSQQFDNGILNDEIAFDLEVDSGGNVFVAGAAHVGFYYEDVDLLLLKYNADGSLAWYRTYDGEEHGYDVGFALAVDPSGNPTVTGSSQTLVELFGLELSQDEFLTIKFSADGTPLWTRTYAGPLGDGGRATVAETDTQGNIYVAGGAIIYAEFGGFDIVTLKYAPDGTLLWTAQYASRSSSIIDPELGLFAPVHQITVDAGGNVFVLGETSLESHEEGYDSDVVVLKYNQAGALQWKQIMGTRGEELPRNLVIDGSGTLYVAADTHPFNPRGYDDRLDASVYALASDGMRLWEWTFNGPDNGEDGNTQVVLDGTGQPYAAFFTQTVESYDMGVVKFAANGSPEWIYRYDSPNHDHDIFQSVVSDGSDGLLFALWTQGFALPDLLTVKMRNSGGAPTPPVLSVALNPTRITPNRSEFGFDPIVEGTVTLSQPAPAGGTVVRLASGNVAVEVPPFVIVSAGQTETTFEAAVNGVDETVAVVVTAEGGGGSATATVTVVAAEMQEFILYAEEVVGGANDSSSDASTFGQITLDGFGGPSGGVVSLSSSNPAVVQIPETLAIGYNDYNAFAVKTTGVSQPTDVVLTATYRGKTLQKTLRVLPARVAYVTLWGENFSNYLPGGVPVTGRVILEGVAPEGGVTVTLSSDDPHLLVPESVFVPAGASAADFAAETFPTSEYALNVNVTAVLGDSEATGALTLHLPILRRVQINSEAIAGGATAEGTVFIDGPAPAEGIVATLESDNAVASVPVEVTIPAGATSATFPITTATVEEGVRVRITARAFGSASALLAVVKASDIPDTVAIQSVGYSSSRRKRNRLNVAATSTSSATTLRVYNADTIALIGTLSNLGGGRYSGSLTVTPKPARITVRSILGGSATADVP